MNEETLQETVEAYLAGTLPKEGVEAFELRLKRDPNFQAQVKPFLVGELAARTYAYEQRQVEFREWFQEGQIRVSLINRIPRWTVLAVAAAVILLLVIIIPRLLPDPSPTPNTLFATYYEPYLPAEMRGVAEVDSQLRFTYRLIYKERYEEAARRLETALDTSSFSPSQRAEQQLYLASCYLALKQPQSALGQLNTLEQGDLDAVNWYKALAYVQMGAFDKARAPLTRLVESQASYYDKRAQSLIQKIPIAPSP